MQKSKGTLETRIESLVTALQDNNGSTRQSARLELEEIGRPSVPYVKPLAKHVNEHVRWEALKALVEIKDTNSAQTFAEALEDDNTDIRWLAAEGLIALGPNGLQTLLKALTKREPNLYMRKGAWHVLRELPLKNTFPKLIELYSILQEDVPEDTRIPVVAEEALTVLQKKQFSKDRDWD